MKLYGRVETNSTIAANASHDTYIDRELPGYLELLGIMVIPDYDPSDGGSNLETARLLIDDKQQMFDFKVNYYYNMLPFSQVHPGKRPMNRFEPSLKINKGRELVIRFVAGATAVDMPYWVRPVGILYDEAEVRERFGLADPTDFETLEGGISQGPSKVEPFVKFATNASATKVGEFYDLEELSFRIYAHQELEVTAIGCVPHTNQDKVQLADIDRTIIAIERPFTTTSTMNELPWGNAWQDAGPYIFPGGMRPIFKDDYIRVQVKDNGTSIPANGVKLWLKGIFRTRG